MKKFLLKVLRPLKYRIETRKMMRPYMLYLEKNLASYGISLSREKLRSYILMQAHIVEKGLSLSNVKPWFGQPKIQSLIRDMKKYYERYEDKKLLYWVVSMLQSYMDFNEGNEGTPTELIEQFEDLKSLLDGFSDERLKGGFVEVNASDCQKECFDYEKFVSSRHSVRSFTGEPIDVTLLHDALRIAETTPSACNRQPWYNCVVTDKRTIEEILAVQGGSRQFKDRISALIITSSSAHFFFGNEFNQMYFNTGLYAMNLLLALHSKGLGTIPLNMGISYDEINIIKKICVIPDEQMPISLIAIGVLPDRYKYAKSARFCYKDYTTFI